MSKDNELPLGWCLTSLGEICTTVKGKKPKDTGEKSEIRSIPYISIKTFESKKIDIYASIGNYTKCEINDILIVWDGARAGLIGNGVKGYIGSTLAKIYSEKLINKFLLYFLKSQFDYINSNTKGVGIPHVDPAILFGIDVGIPPFKEQHRIVTEIEKQFSRLDESVSALKRVQANLKRYKASVLKSAVEGKLTAAWREQHPNLEPAEQLLERILKERREHWEAAELAKMQASGKLPKDNQWKLKYKEPVKPDISMLPELPAGWCYVSFPQIGELNRGKSKHRPRNDKFLYGGIYPFIQTGDIKNAIGVIKNFTQSYSEEGLKQSKLWQKGTLCITIAANIADTAILGIDACFPDSVVGFIPTKYTDVRLIEYSMRTIKNNLERFAPATAQKNINVAILNDVAIPFAPLAEQAQIVAEVEKRLSVAEEVEQQINRNLKRAEHLRQAILKRAFSGKLVPQDPTDKPVGEALASTSTINS